MPRNSLLHLNATNSRRPHLHTINTLFLLYNLPNLVLLRTSQHNQRATIRSVPAMLAILVFQRDSLAGTQSFAVGRQFLVDGYAGDVCKVTHAGVATAFLGFLRRAAEEAMFVCVFAAVLFDTSILEGAEDGVWTIVFCQVFLVLCEFGLVIVEFGFCGLELRLCVGDEFGFGGVVGGGVGEDAVFDEEDAEVTKFRVDPVAYGGGEIFFEFVD
jgi:hypothetical protein